LSRSAHWTSPKPNGSAPFCSATPRPFYEGDWQNSTFEKPRSEDATNSPKKTLIISVIARNEERVTKQSSLAFPAASLRHCEGEARGNPGQSPIQGQAKRLDCHVVAGAPPRNDETGSAGTDPFHRFQAAASIRHRGSSIFRGR
jgi:hypothetical protein